MGDQQLTIGDLLDLTIDMLASISIPVEQIDSIGIPIMNGVRNLRSIQKALIECQMKENEQEK